MSEEDSCVGIRYNQIEEDNRNSRSESFQLEVDNVVVNHEIIIMDDIQTQEGEDIYRYWSI